MPGRDRNEVTVLPDDALTHFNNLCSADLADASADFARLQQEFERGEFSRGRAPGGAGFAARLAKLYAQDLAKRTSIIVTNLKKIHADFGYPLDDDVDGKLTDLGSKTLSQQFQGLEGAYVRHLQRFGVAVVHPSGLDQKYPLRQASVHNLISRYLWTMRKVPMKTQTPPVNQTNVTINGQVGSVQTGAHAVANVQQHWSQREADNLVQALHQLRAAIGGAQGLDAAAREDLAINIDMAQTELNTASPNRARLLNWLGGVGTAVQVVASAKPALEAVRNAARALGLPL